MIAIKIDRFVVFPGDFRRETGYAPPMREVILDTETTGLDPNDGHRVIEIGCVELLGHVPTGREFHVYINPDRDIPKVSTEVHGITAEFLADKKRFADPKIVDAFLDFVADSTIIAHNANFDLRFINHELLLAQRPLLKEERVFDTLALARRRYPNAANSLDALCKRFDISLSGRETHGALKDARLLAQVYLELRGGREQRLEFETPDHSSSAATRLRRARTRPGVLPPRLTGAEQAAHEAMVAELGAKALWLRFGAGSA